MESTSTSAAANADGAPTLGYVTLLADGAGGGWAFGPRPESTPPRVQPTELRHVTMPLCDPTRIDTLAVAWAITTFDEATIVALSAGTQPPHAELHYPAVLLVAIPCERIAVAVGTFADTYSALHWWAAARACQSLSGISAGTFPVIDAVPAQPTR